MIRWEYRIVELDELHAIGALAKVGAEAWELVGFDGRGMAFFKRPIEREMPAALLRNFVEPAKPTKAGVAKK